MVDNFDKVYRRLTFFEPSIYHLQILQRSKDGNDKSVRLIAEWFITSQSRLELLKPGIISLCNIYNARAYISLNGKRPESVVYHSMEKGLEQIKNKQFVPTSIMASSVSNAASQFKVWILDIDEKEADLDLICSRIEQCKSGYTKNVIDILPTVNGYHILTCPFDISEINREGLPKFDIHKNNPTLLYAA